MESIINALREYDRFLICTHTEPDGDALGSVLALTEGLSLMGKQVTPYLEDRPTAQLRFLPGLEQISYHLNEITNYDVGIILDCGELERTGRNASRIGQIRLLINIDHHQPRAQTGHLRLIDPSSSCTGEIIYRLLARLNQPITRNMALNLYTAIVTDTGSFTYSNTNQATFDMAGDLVARGVNPPEVSAHLYQSYPASRMKILSRALETIELTGHGRVAFMIVTQDMVKETGAGPNDTFGFIDFPRSISGVRLAVLFREVDPGIYNVSLRSKGQLNVAALAGRHGGGGHTNAAGLLFKGSAADFKQEALEYVAAASWDRDGG
ncbi:MAG: bifunctional oligoribonuclease/PAP phosphatase NrnA [Deltaproteobacteria bacterium]|nr:bifunctional oligoribonuclease/PAP phosphatase NrnA [Deltaproteobacteria bacterium]